ncbi:MAG: redox-sensing transcriptional repressor Rex [Clostridiales bacterium]|nr:redox-sensing transcriptional repressor Rex [Clostridiales bacterium]
MQMPKTISVQALQRLPTYLNYLKSLPLDKDAKISARALGNALGYGEIQVRKDLSAVSDGGKPKVGYCTAELIRDIEIFLGYDDVNDAVLVGAGKLGKALMSYEGFKTYGLNIVAAFDSDLAKCGTDESGKQVFPIDKMENLCKRLKVRIGIITVPASSAQQVCDILVEGGVEAIWNFAPTHLSVPEEVVLKNENMAASLAILSKHLSEKDWNCP